MCKKKLTQKQFIQKANQVHKDKYDYSEVKYVNSKTEIIIICPIHGNFSQTPNVHLQGSGCKKCGYEKNVKKQACSYSEFIEKAQKVHKDKYDYSKTIYINNHTKVEVFCNTCQEYFFVTPLNLISNKSGCKKCANISKRNKYISNNEDFIAKARIIHNYNFSYNFIIYKGNKIKIEIICNKCNKTFWQTPNMHLSGRGCPYCNESTGEKKIKNWLNQNNIKYTVQKTYSDLYFKIPRCKLRFDFFLPDYNLCIEFDGQQHFEPCFPRNNKELAQVKFDELQQRDQLKTQYCENNKIELLRIPYWDFKNIKKILERRILNK